MPQLGNSANKIGRNWTELAVKLSEGDKLFEGVSGVVLKTRYETKRMELIKLSKEDDELLVNKSLKTPVPKSSFTTTSSNITDAVITRGDVNYVNGEGEGAAANVNAAFDEEINAVNNNNNDSGEATDNLPQQQQPVQLQPTTTPAINREETTTTTESLLPLNNKTVLLVSLIRVVDRSPMMVGAVLDCAARGLRETVEHMNNDRELADAAEMASTASSSATTTKPLVDWVIIIVDDSKEFKTKEIVHNFKNRTPMDAEDNLFIEEVQRKVFYIPIADHSPPSTSTSQRKGRALEVKYGHVSAKNNIGLIKARELCSTYGRAAFVWSVLDDDDITTRAFHMNMNYPVVRGLIVLNKLIVTNLRPNQLLRLNSQEKRLDFYKCPEGMHSPKWLSAVTAHVPFILATEEHDYTPSVRIGEDICMLQNFSSTQRKLKRRVEVVHVTDDENAPTYLPRQFTKDNWWAGAAFYNGPIPDEKLIDQDKWLAYWTGHARVFIESHQRLLEEDGLTEPIQVVTRGGKNVELTGIRNHDFVNLLKTSRSFNSQSAAAAAGPSSSTTTSTASMVWVDDLRQKLFLSLGTRFLRPDAQEFEYADRHFKAAIKHGALAQVKTILNRMPQYLRKIMEKLLKASQVKTPHPNNIINTYQSRAKDKAEVTMAGKMMTSMLPLALPSGNRRVRSPDSKYNNVIPAPAKPTRSTFTVKEEEENDVLMTVDDDDNNNSGGAPASCISPPPSPSSSSLDFSVSGLEKSHLDQHTFGAFIAPFMKSIEFDASVKAYLMHKIVSKVMSVFRTTNLTSAPNSNMREVICALVPTFKDGEHIQVKFGIVPGMLTSDPSPPSTSTTQTANKTFIFDSSAGRLESESPKIIFRGLNEVKTHKDETVEQKKDRYNAASIKAMCMGGCKRVKVPESQLRFDGGNSSRGGGRYYDVGVPLHNERYAIYAKSDVNGIVHVGILKKADNDEFFTSTDCCCKVCQRRVIATLQQPSTTSTSKTAGVVGLRRAIIWDSSTRSTSADVLAVKDLWASKIVAFEDEVLQQRNKNTFKACCAHVLLETKKGDIVEASESKVVWPGTADKNSNDSMERLLATAIEKLSTSAPHPTTTTTTTTMITVVTVQALIFSCAPTSVGATELIACIKRLSNKEEVKVFYGFSSPDPLDGVVLFERCRMVKVFHLPKLCTLIGRTTKSNITGRGFHAPVLSKWVMVGDMHPHWRTHPLSILLSSPVHYDDEETLPAVSINDDAHLDDDDDDDDDDDGVTVDHLMRRALAPVYKGVQLRAAKSMYRKLSGGGRVSQTSTVVKMPTSLVKAVMERSDENLLPDNCVAFVLTLTELKTIITHVKLIKENYIGDKDDENLFSNEANFDIKTWVDKDVIPCPASPTNNQIERVKKLIEYGENWEHRDLHAFLERKKKMKDKAALHLHVKRLSERKQQLEEAHLKLLAPRHSKEFSVVVTVKRVIEDGAFTIDEEDNNNNDGGVVLYNDTPFTIDVKPAPHDRRKTEDKKTESKGAPKQRVFDTELKMDNWKENAISVSANQRSTLLDASNEKLSSANNKSIIQDDRLNTVLRNNPFWALFCCDDNNEDDKRVVDDQQQPPGPPTSLMQDGMGQEAPLAMNDSGNVAGVGGPSIPAPPIPPSQPPADPPSDGEDQRSQPPSKKARPNPAAKRKRPVRKKPLDEEDEEFPDEPPQTKKKGGRGKGKKIVKKSAEPAAAAAASSGGKGKGRKVGAKKSKAVAVGGGVAGTRKKKAARPHQMKQKTASQSHSGKLENVQVIKTFTLQGKLLKSADVAEKKAEKDGAHQNIDNKDSAASSSSTTSSLSLFDNLVKGEGLANQIKHGELLVDVHFARVKDFVDRLTKYASSVSVTVLSPSTPVANTSNAAAATQDAIASASTLSEHASKKIDQFEVALRDFKEAKEKFDSDSTEESTHVAGMRVILRDIVRTLIVMQAPPWYFLPYVHELREKDASQFIKRISSLVEFLNVDLDLNVVPPDLSTSSGINTTTTFTKSVLIPLIEKIKSEAESHANEAFRARAIEMELFLQLLAQIGMDDAINSTSPSSAAVHSSSKAATRDSFIESFDLSFDDVTKNDNIVATRKVFLNHMSNGGGELLTHADDIADPSPNVASSSTPPPPPPSNTQNTPELNPIKIEGETGDGSKGVVLARFTVKKTQPDADDSTVFEGEITIMKPSTSDSKDAETESKSDVTFKATREEMESFKNVFDIQSDVLLMAPLDALTNSGSQWVGTMKNGMFLLSSILNENLKNSKDMVKEMEKYIESLKSFYFPWRFACRTTKDAVKSIKKYEGFCSCSTHSTGRPSDKNHWVTPFESRSNCSTEKCPCYTRDKKCNEKCKCIHACLESVCIGKHCRNRKDIIANDKCQVILKQQKYLDDEQAKKDALNQEENTNSQKQTKTKIKKIAEPKRKILFPDLSSSLENLKQKILLEDETFTQSSIHVFKSFKNYFDDSMTNSKLWLSTFEMIFKKNEKAGDDYAFDINSHLINDIKNDGMRRVSGLTRAKAESKLRRVESTIKRPRNLHLGIPTFSLVNLKPPLEGALHSPEELSFQELLFDMKNVKTEEVENNPDAAENEEEQGAPGAHIPGDSDAEMDEGEDIVDDGDINSDDEDEIMAEPQSASAPPPVKIKKKMKKEDVTKSSRKVFPFALIQDVIPSFDASLVKWEKVSSIPAAREDDDADDIELPFWTSMFPDKKDHLSLFNPSETHTAYINVKGIPYYLLRNYTKSGMDKEIPILHTRSVRGHKGLTFRLPPRHFAIMSNLGVFSQLGISHQDKEDNRIFSTPGGAIASMTVTIYAYNTDENNYKTSPPQINQAGPTSTTATTTQHQGPRYNFGHIRLHTKLLHPSLNKMVIPEELPTPSSGWTVMKDEHFTNARCTLKKAGDHGSLGHAGLAKNDLVTLRTRTKEENDAIKANHNNATRVKSSPTTSKEQHHHHINSMRTAEYRIRPLLDSETQTKQFQETWGFLKQQHEQQQPDGDGGRSHIFLDPGGRTLFTGILVTPDGIFEVQLGHNTYQRMAKEKREYSYLQSQYALAENEIKARLNVVEQYVFLRSQADYSHKNAWNSLRLEYDEVMNGIDNAELKAIYNTPSNLTAESIIDLWHKAECDRRLNKTKLELNKSLNLMSSIVKKAHENCCSYLTNLADVIVLPVLKSHEIAKRASKHVSGMLMSLAHGEFRTLLKRRCANSGVKLELFKEPYSTQMCGVCQHMHKHIGKAKVHRCPNCNSRQDRDGGAARNIACHYLYTKSLRSSRRSNSVAMTAAEALVSPQYLDGRQLFARASTLSGS